METLQDSRIDNEGQPWPWEVPSQKEDTALTEKELATGYTEDCQVPCAGETGLMIKTPVWIPCTCTALPGDCQLSTGAEGPCGFHERDVCRNTCTLVSAGTASFQVTTVGGNHHLWVWPLAPSQAGSFLLSNVDLPLESIRLWFSKIVLVLLINRSLRLLTYRS